MKGRKSWKQQMHELQLKEQKKFYKENNSDREPKNSSDYSRSFNIGTAEILGHYGTEERFSSEVESAY